VTQADGEYCPLCGVSLGAEGQGQRESSRETTKPGPAVGDPGQTEVIGRDEEPKAQLKIKLPTGDEYFKPITKGEVRLGKGPHNDIVIADPSVSSVHALIAFGDNGYTISDLGSRNGTYVNQERVVEPRALRSGDLINLGRSRLTFQSSSAGDTVTLPPVDFEPPTLVGVMPDGTRIERVIDRPEIDLGKAPHNQVVLADPTVSSAHAVILSKGGEYCIVDLGSRNGTYVDGEKLGSEPRVLKHGDTIRVGSTVLTFRRPSRAVESTTALPMDLGQASQGSNEVEVEPAGGIAGGALSGTTTVVEAIPGIAAAGAAPAVEVGAEPAEVKDKPGEKEKSKDKGKGKDKAKDQDKKKKKKKEKDERLRAAYIGALGRVVAAVLSVILTVGIAFYIKEGGFSGKPQVTAGRKGKAKLKFSDVTAASPISGGNFEASGVVQVPGTNGVLLVDDTRSSQVLWMQLDDSGHQVGAARPVELGATVEDAEAITYGGSYFYVAGSQSDPKADAGNSLLRFLFDPANATLRGKADVISDLRSVLVKQVPELKSVSADEKYAINIEGITWDPDHERLLLGMRAPVVDGQALIVPVKLHDAHGAFTADNLEFGAAMRLPLGGLGIRDIQYDSRLKSFLIIAGQSSHHDKKVFKLWEWDGNPVKAQDETSLREDVALDEKIKPEGIARVVIGDHDYLLVVGDAGSYYKIDYSKVE
jgi:pSer/pThr/pTyr-binding forkhead associated (FHA) protein